ncbi:MAG: hypothetical protein MI725_06570, partial [Pirellulales bacterium]|nr:hypothetical protein [Pirellulales bacterium]
MKRLAGKGPVFTALLFGCVTLLLPSSSFGINYVWDGSQADGNWTNGPQNNSTGAFPVNGIVGRNWTVGASTGQLAEPDATTPGGNMIDYLYTGHDFDITSALISEDVQIRLKGGSL